MLRFSLCVLLALCDANESARFEIVLEQVKIIQTLAISIKSHHRHQKRSTCSAQSLTQLSAYMSGVIFLVSKNEHNSGSK